MLSKGPVQIRDSKRGEKPAASKITPWTCLGLFGRSGKPRDHRSDWKSWLSGCHLVFTGWILGLATVTPLIKQVRESMPTGLDLALACSCFLLTRTPLFSTPRFHYQSLFSRSCTLPFEYREILMSAVPLLLHLSLPSSDVHYFAIVCAKC